MNNNNYEDPILAKIRDILNAEIAPELRKRIYVGEPLVVAKSELPLCFVNYKKQTVEDSSSFEIETRAVVNVTVCYDMTRDLSGNKKDSANHNALTAIMAGRGKDLKFLPSSVIGILMKNQDMEDLPIKFNLGSGVELTYDYLERGTNVFTSEISLQFEVAVSQLVG